MTLAVVDLPQPDSPTIPTVSPGMSLIETWLTAWTRLGWRSEPVRVLNVTEMSSRKMMGSFSAFCAALIYITSEAVLALMVSR